MTSAASRTAFTVREGRAAGLSRAVMRGDAFRKPVRGTRMAGPGSAEDVDTRDDLIAALRALARPDHFFSHATAALIHGIPIPRRLEPGPVHVASPSFTARMRRPGMIGHRIESRVVEVQGLRVEAPEDAFVHLATLLTVDELVAVGDWIVNPRRPGHISLEQLAASTARYRGARGMAIVDRALSLVREGAESPKETELRLRICSAGLPEPTLQLQLREPDGTVWARLDLGYPELKLAIEYDGEQHRTDDDQYGRDGKRMRRLRDEGWYVITITKHDLRDGGRAVLAHIRAVHARLVAERVAAAAGR